MVIEFGDNILGAAPPTGITVFVSVESGDHSDAWLKKFADAVSAIRFAGIEALEQAPAIGGIVELRAIARTGEASSRLILANRSDLDLAAQIKAPGATWLDRRLIERGAGIANGGFGHTTACFWGGIVSWYMLTIVLR